MTFRISSRSVALIGGALLMLSLGGCRTMLTSTFGLFGKITSEERTAGEIVDDGTIHAELTHYFVQADVNDMLMNVTARVHEGRVLLTGTVNKPETAREAVRLAWIPRGVHEVINKLEANDTSGIIDDAKDQWIETQIETRLLATHHIRSLNYTVEVENGIVYLLGIAQDEEELRNVAHISSITKNVQKVESFVRMKEDPRSLER